MGHLQFWNGITCIKNTRRGHKKEKKTSLKNCEFHRKKQCQFWKAHQNSIFIDWIHTREREILFLFVKLYLEMPVSTFQIDF